MRTAAATGLDANRIERLVKALVAETRTGPDSEPAEMRLVMGQFVEDFGPSMAAIVPTCECIVRGMTTTRLSDYLGSESKPALFVMARHEEKGGLVLVRLGRDALDWWVSSALGGAPGHLRGAPRPISNVEARLGRVAVDLALQSLVRVLSSLGLNVAFHECRMVTEASDVPRAPDDPWMHAVAIGLAGQSEDRVLDLVVSERLAREWSEVVRSNATRDDSVAQGKSPDKGWIDGMEAQLAALRVPVEALLCDEVVCLGDVARWSLGQLIPLDVTAAEPVRLVSNGVVLFSGDLGKRSGCLSVRIGAALDRRHAPAGAPVPLP